MSKGGAEKARIKKRKALGTDAAKCEKIGSFSIKRACGLKRPMEMTNGNVQGKMNCLT